ncbi:MAG: FkbM family methyltransferase, partial [Limisphaerales bacterium]
MLYGGRLERLVTRQARHLIKAHTSQSSGKALFIDMGSNLGQGFKFFSRYYDPNIFDYWLVEPNPFCLDSLKKNVSEAYIANGWTGEWQIINAAVFSADGTLSLYGLVEDHRGKTSDGASVIKDHGSARYKSDENQALKVRSIRASKFISDAADKYSTIVVKMDIESSEYDVLEDLIGTGLVNTI